MRLSRFTREETGSARARPANQPSAHIESVRESDGDQVGDPNTRTRDTGKKSTTVAARNRSKLALATLGVALLLGASRAAEDLSQRFVPIGGTLGNLAPEMNDSAGNMTEMANDTIADDENLAWGPGGFVAAINLAPEMNDSAGNMTEIAEGHLGDDINVGSVELSNAFTVGVPAGRRSLLDGGIPLTVEGSDTTTSLGDEVEGLLPRLEKIPPQGLDMAPLAELEAEAPAFENAPSGVAGVDFAAGPESSTSEVPAPSGEASPAEGGVGGGMPMNGTMAGNMTMDAPTEMANDTINEAPDMAGVEMPPVTDLGGRSVAGGGSLDGRRRMRMRMRRRSLAQFEGLENAVNDAVGRVEDFGKQVSSLPSLPPSLSLCLSSDLCGFFKFERTLSAASGARQGPGGR